MDIHQLWAGHCSGSAQYLHRVGHRPPPVCRQSADVGCNDTLYWLGKEDADTPRHVPLRCPARTGRRLWCMGTTNSGPLHCSLRQPLRPHSSGTMEEGCNVEGGSLLPTFSEGLDVRDPTSIKVNGCVVVARDILQPKSRPLAHVWSLQWGREQRGPDLVFSCSINRFRRKSSLNPDRVQWSFQKAPPPPMIFFSNGRRSAALGGLL